MPIPQVGGGGVNSITVMGKMTIVGGDGGDCPDGELIRTMKEADF